MAYGPEVDPLVKEAEERIRKIVIDLDNRLRDEFTFGVIGLDLDTRRFAGMRVDVIVG